MTRWRRVPGFRSTVMLGVLLIATLAVGVWGIVAARRNAVRELERELALETDARARAVEAVLASLRGDFLFMAQAPPLRQLPAALAGGDAVQRRWARIDAEAMLLLFLEAHPEVERLVIETTEAPVLAAGRREGTPALLLASLVARAPAPARETIIGRWPVDDGTSLVTEVSVPALLRRAVPTEREAHLRLLDPVDPRRSATGPALVHLAAVNVPSWSPPLALMLEHADPTAGSTAGVLRLAGHFRTTFLLSLVLTALAFLFGIVAYREVRRGAALEATRAHEVRLRDLERQVLHSERLASVGRLAAGIAHEINNPLEGMSGYLDLLRADLEDGRIDPGRARGYVEKVREGLGRAASVTRQVLTYAAPGHAPRTRVDLVHALGETAAFLRSKPALACGEIRISSAAERVSVHGNPVTLGQVFLNLLLNAVEAGPNAPIDVDVASDDAWAIVTVRDRGPGVAPELAQKVFEPFYSGRGSTGLGLSVCHGIVSDHGGTIEAGTHAEGGAVFTVRLPLDETTEARA